MIIDGSSTETEWNQSDEVINVFSILDYTTNIRRVTNIFFRDKYASGDPRYFAGEKEVDKWSWKIVFVSWKTINLLN